MDDGQSRHAVPAVADISRHPAQWHLRDRHPIGVGGMGEIYKGHAIQTGDPVAIKMLLPELAENEAALALFRKEASALHFLASRRDRALLRFHHRAGAAAALSGDGVRRRPLAVRRSCRKVRSVRGGADADAAARRRLQAAHERGIVHRDLSPDNIIVRAATSRAPRSSISGLRARPAWDGTVIGSGFAGKQNYVSPEHSALRRHAGAKSDIYSLGLVLFQAFTGRALDMGGSQVESSRSGERCRISARSTCGYVHSWKRCCSPIPKSGPPRWRKWPPGRRVARRAGFSTSCPGTDANRRPGVPKNPSASRVPAAGEALPASLVVILLVGGAAGAYHFIVGPLPISWPPFPDWLWKKNNSTAKKAPPNNGLQPPETPPQPPRQPSRQDHAIRRTV